MTIKNKIRLLIEKTKFKINRLFTSTKNLLNKLLLSTKNINIFKFFKEGFNSFKETVIQKNIELKQKLNKQNEKTNTNNSKTINKELTVTNSNNHKEVLKEQPLSVVKESTKRISLTKKIKPKKVKTALVTFLSIVSVSVVITFVSIFTTNGQAKVAYDDQSNSGSRGLDLNLENEILSQKENLNLLVSMKFFNNNQTVSYYFDEGKIKSYIFSIIDDALYLNNSFDDSPSEYTKTLKYKFLNGQKQVLFNLFLYNKSVKSKRFVSNFKLSII